MQLPKRNYQYLYNSLNGNFLQTHPIWKIIKLSNHYILFKKNNSKYFLKLP